MSSLSATENFKLNPKAIYQSPAGSCTRISNNFLPDVEKSPLLLAALNSSELVFYAPSGTKKKTPVHSSGGAPQLECPEDISTYTDINSCSSFIAGGLNTGFDETEVVTLTWEMFGATSDASPAQGINLIDDYTFDEGATIITYTATGTDGTTSSCTFTVTISDNQVPRLESIPAGITVETAPGACAATVYWIEPTATDNCTAPHLLVKEATHYPGDEFPVGTTTVYYTAYDAMGNPSQTESFTITVKDNEPPVLSLPSDVTLACNDPLPAPWTTLQQLTASGGSATDNCTIDAASFRLLSETPSSTVCPYTLTRVYRIADASGNITTAEHRIVVEGEGETVQPDQEEEVQLKSGMADYTAIKSGPWNDIATWGGVGPPTSTDNVTIPTGITVYVSDITIDGSLTLDDGASLEVTGNWTNNGTFTAETNSTVIFTGTTSPVSISGTNTTIFKNFELDKGAGNILNVNSDIELDGTITFTSGIMQISSGTSVICTHNAGFTIEEDAGVVISGGTFTTGPFSVENEGFIRIDSGALTFGTNSGNGVVIRNSGQLEINGGIVNVAGRLEVSGGTVDISDGTINLNTVGHSSATLGTLDLSLSSVWNMTGGTLNFENPSGAYDVVIKNSSGSKTFGGTINFGDGTSQTYKITSQVPFPGFNVASNTNIILEMLVSSDGTYNFPLVDGAGISIPASVTISGSGYTDASVQIETTGSKHDDNASSTNYLNRYWAITTSGITSPDYDVTVTYAPADIAGTESEIAAGLWTGSLPWGKGGVANSVNNSITFSGITVASADITGITLEPPTLEINNGNASETICNGSSITLNTTVTGDPTFNYSWDPTTDLDLTDPANPIADPSTTTTYEVTVTDGNGFTATDDIDVIVDPQSVGGTIAGGETVCSGTNSTLLTLSDYTGTIQKWEYSTDGGSNWIDIANPGDTYTVTNLTQTTSYRAWVKSGVCSEAVSTEKSITVNPLPTLATASQDAEVCDGNPATINLTGLLPNTTFTVEYTIDGTSQAPVAGLAADASGNSSFSTGNLTTSNNGQILQITGITITSATPNCSGAFAVDAPLSVNTPPTFTACPDSPINLNTEVGVCTAIANYTATADATPLPTYTYEFTGATTGSDAGTGSGSSFNVGVTNVKVTATNICGAAECKFDVIVTDDQLPTINCPTPSNPYSVDPGECTSTLSLEATASDNCAIENIKYYINAGTTEITFPYAFPSGITTVWAIATDINGNTNECTFNVQVTDDIDPSITCPGNISVENDPGECYAVVDYTAPTGTDNCAGAITEQIAGLPPGAQFPVGTTTNTFEVTDAIGNKAQCSFTVTVSDTEYPIIECPENIFDVDCNNTTIFIPDPTIIENCGYTLSWSTTGATIGSGSGSIGITAYAEGVTTVNYTVTDAAGNSSSCSFTVTIAESSKNCSAGNIRDILFFGDINGDPIDKTSCTVGDPYSVYLWVNVTGPNAYSLKLQYDLYIDGIYIDSYDYPCFWDGENILPGTYRLVQIDLECGQQAELKNIYLGWQNRQNANCGCSNPAQCSSDPEEEIPSPLVVDFSYDLLCDAPDQQFQKVIITDETIGGSGNYTYEWDFGTDADPASSQSSEPIEVNYSSSGTKTITLKVTDTNGTTSTETKTIEIDCCPPSITCPAVELSYETDEGECFATLSFEATSTNFCIDDVIKYYIGANEIGFEPSGYQFPVGTTTVRAEVTDGNNFTDECTFDVVVVDNEDPVIICPPSIWLKACSLTEGETLNTLQFSTTERDITVEQLNIAHGVANPDPYNKYASDNCGIQSITYRDVAVGTCPIVVTRTFTITDLYGNTKTCYQTIELDDITPPEIECPADVPSEIIVNTGNTYVHSGNTWDATATDNCGAVTLVAALTGATTSTDPHYNSLDRVTFNEGITTVTWTATDACGNTDECTFDVKVIGQADIAVTKALTSHEGVGPIAAGDEVIYTITVTSNGPAVAPEVVLTDNLPTGLTNSQYSTDNGVTYSPWTNSLTYNNLGVGQGEAKTIMIKADAGCPTTPDATITNTATVALAAPLTDPDNTNNSATVETDFIDNTPPTFTQNPPDFTECVDMLYQAVYDTGNDLLRYLDHNGASPDPYLIDNTATEDFFLFISGNPGLDLDLDAIGYTDNCCLPTDGYSVEWTITFDANTPNGVGGTTITGSGQPSAHPDDIKLWGDRVNYQSLTHTIKYIITDCNTNESSPVTRNIIITPRPEIIKLTGP